jgi:hypothetical protein
LFSPGNNEDFHLGSFLGELSFGEIKINLKFRVMNENFSELSKEEQLKAENEFLKMKLMLEHGAKFSEKTGNLTEELPSEIENQFLNNIVAFEKQFAERKTTTVGARLPELSGFKKPGELKPAEYEASWKKLRTYLNENGIDLDACSYNVTPRELYRFVLEELINHEMDDIVIPGMICGFIYDEFYPDPIYESEKAVKYFFEGIWDNEQLDEFAFFLPESFSLNGNFFAKRNEFIKKINVFKSFHDELELDTFQIDQNNVSETSEVSLKGIYQASGKIDNEEKIYSGSFDIFLSPTDNNWEIKEVNMTGLTI